MCCRCLLIHKSEIRHITSGLLVRLFIMFMMSFGAPWMIRSYDVGGQRLCASNDKSDLFCMVIEHKTNTFKFLHLPLYGRHKM